MSTETRKQREIRQREAEILKVARHMLTSGGYNGLSMDRIATELEYAKGTIYNHFGCKEEIILAIANETLDRRTSMFERAAAFRGRSRERLAAIGVAAELFVRRFAEHFQLEQIIRSASIWEKTSEVRRNVMRNCETKCVGTVGGVVRDGLASGDLTLPSGASVEDLVFGLWSLTYGAYTIIATSESLGEIGIPDPFSAVRLNVNRMLDGCNWQPLSSEHDYAAVRERVLLEVFPNESRELEAA